MNIKSYLQNEYRNLLREQTSLKRSIQKLPAQEIKFHRNGKYCRWFAKNTSDSDRKGSTVLSTLDSTDSKKAGYYLSKVNDRPLASKLAIRTFLTNKLKTINVQICMIEKFLKDYPQLPDYPENIDDACTDYLELLSPYFLEKQKFVERWLSENNNISQEHIEGKIVPTKSGIMVRSKSEAIIADQLYENHLPFKYELMHCINGINVCPDFTILNTHGKGEQIIWEHFGMMDNPIYVQKTNSKLSLYFNAGYLPGRNLITTYEDKANPLDINYVVMQIGCLL